MGQKSLKISVLGSGTSTGVPLAACDCPTCTSSDPKNKRLRCSLAVQVFDNTNQIPCPPTVLIDTSTDFRFQALRAGLKRVDAVLYTHAHSDHILGLDDLRPFNFVSKSEIPVYADEASGKHLHRMFGYAFEYDEHYQGGAPPRLVLKTLQPYSAVNLFGVDFLPLPIMHGKNQILGFRIGDFAYMTDCSEIPAKTLKHLDGLRYLIIDGLRNRVHRTHFTHEQAVRYIEQIKPAKAFLTHISHEIDHNEGNKRLKDLTALDVELAYDGLSFEF